MKHTYTPVILGLLSALSNVSGVSEVTKKIRREQRITNAELHGNKLPQTTVVNCSPKKYGAHLFQTVDAAQMIDRIFDCLVCKHVNSQQVEFFLAVSTCFAEIT